MPTPRRIGAVAHHDVVKADAAGGDGDPDLARTRLARRDVGDAQDLGRTGPLSDDGTHQTAAAQFAESQPEMIFHLPPSAFMIAPDSAPAWRSDAKVSGAIRPVS